MRHEPVNPPSACAPADVEARYLANLPRRSKRMLRHLARNLSRHAPCELFELANAVLAHQYITSADKAFEGAFDRWRASLAPRVWTTDGLVRGSCGHRHRSRETAERCLARDRDGCASQGGYSDRRVVRA